MRKFKQYDLVAVDHDSDVVYRVMEVDGNMFRLVDASIDMDSQRGWWHDMSGWKTPTFRQHLLAR